MRRALCMIIASVLFLGFLAVPSQSLETGSLTLPEIAIPIGGGVQLSMSLIPAGRFMMGSPDDETDRYSDEGPQHEVTISKSFYMGIIEVTQAQWAAVMGTTPSYFGGNEDNPVEQVSWYDCQEFLQKINTLGLGTFRLPTEAEWEYACRAGSTTRFPWGDDPDYSSIDQYAWYKGNSNNKTQTVGLKKPNSWGLYDMHGNVWEWCNDWYACWDERAQADPNGPSSGSKRIVRGGSCSSAPEHCRSANRPVHSPASVYISLGFRLVRITP